MVLLCSHANQSWYVLTVVFLKYCMCGKINGRRLVGTTLLMRDEEGMSYLLSE
jgi:hypothetical protein